MKNPAELLEEFDRHLTSHNIRGQWRSEEFLSKAIGGPSPAGVVKVWKWDLVSSLLKSALTAMPESMRARRSLIFQNPGLPRGTTHTINMGVQMIEPGETAWAHRHSIAALRFIIKGNRDLYTFVDGRAYVMEENDLVLTPNWMWHDHHNELTLPAYWLDVLDVPLILGLNQVFYEPGELVEQPLAQAPSALGELRYPWSQVQAAMRNCPVTSVRGQAYEYRSKEGGSCLPTLDCRAQRLPPAFQTANGRTTASSVYHVIEGHGVMITDQDEYEWGPRDCFVVPNWTPYMLKNLSASNDAWLFSVHDSATLRPLGLLKEEFT